MAIAKKPTSHPTASNQQSERAAEAFIAGAATPARKERAAIMLRLDAGLLERIDRAAKTRGVNRTAWLLYTVSAALDHADQ